MLTQGGDYVTPQFLGVFSFFFWPLYKFVAHAQCLVAHMQRSVVCTQRSIAAHSALPMPCRAHAVLCRARTVLCRARTALCCYALRALSWPNTVATKGVCRDREARPYDYPLSRLKIPCSTRFLSRQGRTLS